jgi:hypothetical protein
MGRVSAEAESSVHKLPLTQQIAAIYELQHFKDYAYASVPILEHLRGVFVDIKDVRAAPLIVAIDDTLKNWNMYTFGATVDTVHGDGNLYRQNEYVSGKYGFITIRANGTYTWKVTPADPPARYIKGTWRNATKEEMGLRGGAGIVLQKAAVGSDWIVYKYLDEKYMPGGIDVRELPSQSGGNRTRGWKA